MKPIFKNSARIKLPLLKNKPFDGIVNDMILLSKLPKKILTFLPADYCEKRGGNHLLVWRDMPHWMVVDEEFYSLLKKFDGRKTLGVILETIGKAPGESKELLLEIRNLISLGILTEEDSSRKKNVSRGRKIPIESIAINVTRGCNLKCRYCYNNDGPTKAHSSELSGGEIVSFLKQIKPYLSKKCALNLLGGEPLLASEKLIEIARYGRKNGFNMLVSTNGTMITDDFAKQAGSVGLEVQVSVDGHNAGLNDGLRGEGVFEQIEEGLKILVENGVHTIVSMVCCKDNFAYLEDYYKWAKSLGVNEARFIPLKNMGSACGEKIEPVSMLEMIKEAGRIFGEKPELKELAGRDCFSIIANTCRYSNKRVSCGSGLQTVLLDADGSIYPCLNTNMGEFRIANIRDDDFNFGDIWESSPVLKRIRENSCIETMNNQCSKCIVKYWCLGGCRGETFAVTGKLNGPSNNCRDYRVSILEIFWILSESPDTK